MQDLNDLYYFVQVVDHGGFAPAGRALGMQKSKLSRRVGLLEDRLGVRLIQRSTRRFSITEVGQEYYRQCQAMLVEAEAAQAVIDNVRSEPRGIIRMTCPPGLLNYHFGELIAQFMAKNPLIEVQLKSVNRPVDVIGEGYDLAIRVGFEPLRQSDLMVRKLGEVPQCLVGSPALLNIREAVNVPADLAGLPSLDFGTAHADHPSSEPTGSRYQWCLEHPDGLAALVPHTPRLISDDLPSLRAAALHGLGIVQLPDMAVAGDIETGRLVDVLPDWRPRSGLVHAIFPSRRGLLPSIRALLDYLALECTPYRRSPAND